MEKRQGEEQQRGDANPPPASPPAPPGRGVDTLSLATLIGVAAVLVISFASWRDVGRIDRSLGERLDRLEARIDQVGNRAPAPAPAPALAPAPQRGPDPNQVYTVRTDGAPARGKASAPVTIVEFSDFQ